MDLFVIIYVFVQLFLSSAKESRFILIESDDFIFVTIDLYRIPALELFVEELFV